MLKVFYCEKIPRETIKKQQNVPHLYDESIVKKILKTSYFEKNKSQTVFILFEMSIYFSPNGCLSIKWL